MISNRYKRIYFNLWLVQSKYFDFYLFIFILELQKILMAAHIAI